MLKYYDDIHEMRDVGPTRRNEFIYWQQLLRDSDPNNPGEPESRVRAAINAYVDNKLAEHGWTEHCWFCSSFVPGKVWTHTPYQIIYDVMEQRYGSEGNLAWNQSRLFFGLLVKDVMIRRPEHWICYKVPEKEEMEKGTNYFPDFAAQAAVAV
jgi:hypothetical protein